MAERKSFLLRMDRELLDAVQRWANDDLRSLNGQIEFLLQRALQKEGRAPKVGGPVATATATAAPADGRDGRMSDRDADGPEP
jgi:hypothetical protein